MNDQTHPDPSSPTSTGYSLLALFLLVTTAGVVAALARTVRESTVHAGILAAHGAVGAFFGMWVGGATGAAHPRGSHFAWLGIAVGAGTGAVCSALAVAAPNMWLFVGGSAGLVAMGLAARVMQRRPRR